MSNTASETIFTTDRDIIPMADVVFIEKRTSEYAKSVNMICIVMKNTTYNSGTDEYNNAAFLTDAKDGSYKDATSFIEAWCHYRSEIDGIA